MVRHLKRLILFLILMFSLLLPYRALASPHIDSVTATMIGSDPSCRYYIYEVRAKVNNAIWCDCFTLNDYFMVYVEYPAILRGTWWTPKYPCINHSCPPQSVEEIILVGVPPGATLAIKVVAGRPLAGYGGLWVYTLAQAPSEPPQNCECELSINVSPSDISPQKAGSANTTSTIMVSTTKPAPPEGCTVNFKVEPINTIGHNHDGNRPKGTVTPATLTIPGGSPGAVSAEYKSSEVSGEEKIIAEIKGEKKGEATVNVKVPGLSPLVSKPSLLPWGGTAEHKLGDNNYGTGYTLSAVYYAVGKYAKDHALNTAPDVYLAVIDMSLPYGGLFDINGDWDTPHDWHRVGRSVDFSKYYKDSGGNNIQVVFYDEDGNVIKTTDLITDDDLDKYFAEKKYKCTRKEKSIGKIHYECPK